MSSTTTLLSPLSHRRPPKPKRIEVPVLLESFPLPPSHIPSTPTRNSISSINSLSNPPPSLPPSLPLPPVPGPSPISEHDTLLFLATSRSRRASKVSLSSSASPPSPVRSRSESNASMKSAWSYHVTPETPLRPSPRSSGSRTASFSDHRPSVADSISEEDPADMAKFDVRTVSPIPQQSDMDHDQDTITFPANITADPPLASIDMQDLPALRDEDVNPQELNLQMRASRSKSKKHQEAPRARSSSPGYALSSYSRIPTNSRPPLPSRDHSVSPDITDILSTTPRPRKNSGPSLSRPRSQSQALRKQLSETFSGFDSTPVSSVRGRGGLTKQRSESNALRSAYRRNEEIFVSEFGSLVGHDHDDEDEPHLDLAKLERQLEDDDSDSDSSLDLHTPLPHLMVKHGLLSPNSKLLPAPVGRPGSAMSMASVMTKSGLMKDDRDTPRRRTRHRDGKTLRGGLGLTTGLGWSDSEDEDAPSALTRRVSNITMSRRPSVASVRSAPLSLSHSTSSLALLEEDTDEEWQSASATRNKTRSHPPSAMRKGILSSTSTRSSFGSVTSSRSSYNNMIRRTASDISVRSDAAYATSSSSSNASIPPPITPISMESDPIHSPPMSPTSVYGDKSLPPLPSCLIKPSASGLGAPRHSAPVFRPRTQSNASSTSSVGNRQNLATPPPTPKLGKVASLGSTPRPLQLVQSKSIPNMTRSISFSPGTSTESSRAPSRAGITSLPASARTLSSGSTGAKPKPRIGAGMTYRTNGSQIGTPKAQTAPTTPTTPASTMRAPSGLRTPSYARTAVYEPRGIAI